MIEVRCKMISKLTKEYKERFLELRGLINSWDLIPDSPLDEFDALNYLFLSMLYNGSDQFKITRSIHHELNLNYGLSMTIGNTEKTANEVLCWWEKFK